MKNTITLFLLLVIFSNLAFAQTPSIRILSINTTCLNKVTKIPVSTSGTFLEDNKFSVQISTDNYNDTKIYEFPAELKNGNIEVVITDSTLTTFSYLKVRVASSSPRVLSSYYTSFRVYHHGSINLQEAASKNLNAYDLVTLTLNGRSNSEWRYTLSDSSNYYNSYGDYTRDFSVQAAVYPEKSQRYTIAHAENACGAMRVSGSANIQVNPVSVKTVRVNPSDVCQAQNTPLKVFFATGMGTISQSAKYKVRFTPMNNDGKELDGTLGFDAEAKLEEGVLLTQIPSEIKVLTSTSYSVRVIVDNPAIVGSFEKTYVVIHPEPKVEFETQSTSVYPGQSYYLSLKYYGASPFVIHLSDGTDVAGYGSGGSYYYTSKEIRPLFSTEYSVKSVESVCGNIPISNSPVLKLTVPATIYLSEWKTSKIYCEGEKVRLKITSNADLPANSNYQMEINYGYQISKTVSVTRDGDYIEFIAPTITDYPVSAFNRTKVFTFKLLVGSVSSVPITQFTIQAKPNFDWYTNNTYYQGESYISYGLLGGGPYTMVKENGETSTSEWDNGSLNSIVSKAESFGYKRIANECFVNENPTRLYINPKPNSNPDQQLTFVASKYEVCNGDSVEIELYAPGVFGENNKFNIQVSGLDGQYDYKTLSTTDHLGKFKIKLSDTYSTTNGTSYVQLRVTSTNPVLISYTKSIQLYGQPTRISLDFSPYNNNYQFLITDDLSARISGSGAKPSSVLLNNGYQDETILLNGYYTNFPVSPKLGLNTYTIKSITTQCGVVPMNVSAEIKVVPYTFRLADGRSSYYSPGYYGVICPDVLMSLPIVVSKGKSEGSTFEVQAKKYPETEFVKVVGGLTKDNMNFKIPSSMSTGTYNIRVVSSEGVIADQEGVLEYKTLPTAKLTSNGKTGNFMIEAREYFPYEVNITGTGTNKTVSNFSPPWEYESSTITGFINPLKSTEYKLNSVSNQCGYGTVSGLLNVTVNPKLTFQQIYSNYYCTGSEIKVTYSLDGDTKANDYILFELLLQGTSKVLYKDSTNVKIGNMLFKLPENLGSGNYFLRARVPQYNQLQQTFFEVKSKPDIVLSGSGTINPGGKASLFLTNKNYSSYQSIKYELSDGATGEYNENDVKGSYITVSPNATTSYTIKSVSNVCGAGQVKGSALITVNPPASRTVDITNVYRSNGSNNICSLDSVLVAISTSGTFSASNKFTVQLSDSTGANFRDIPTLGNSSPLKTFITGDYPSAAGYRMRIASTDSDVGSGTYQFPLILRKRASARFATDFVAFQSNDNPKIVVKLEGDAPWQYSYGTDVNSRTVYTYNSSDTLTLLQASPSVYYKLYSVINACGVGVLDSPNTVRVEVVTGLEDPSKLVLVNTYPNPASDFLILEFSHAAPRQVVLYNVSGTALKQVNTSLAKDGMDIRDLVPGTYLLNIKEGEKSKTLRIVKDK